MKQLVSGNQATALSALETARQLGWLDPESCYFQQADLAQADLSTGNLSRANLWKANFEKATLVNIQFEEVILAAANLQGANLTGANFESAQLGYTNFQQASLTDAVLCNAMCTGTNFYQAKLTRTDFTNAQLGGANFLGCDLIQANLLDAGLAGTNLRGANISEQQLAMTSMMRGATMPDGGRYDGRYRLKGDIALCLELGCDIHDAQEMARRYWVELDDYLDGQKWADKHLDGLQPGPSIPSSVV